MGILEVLNRTVFSKNNRGNARRNLQGCWTGLREDGSKIIIIFKK